MPLGAAGLGAEDAIDGVEIDGPAAEGDCVGMGSLFDDVLLNEHEVALEASAFAFAGDGADPFECEGFSFGEDARVFDVVPDAVGHFPEFHFDGFAVVDGVESAAPFDPPEAAAAFPGFEVAPARDLGDV